MRTTKRYFTIRAKLMRSFIAVILFTAVVSVVAVSTITRNQFHRYAHEADLEYAASMAPVLGSFYEAYGNWNNVESALISDSDRDNWSMGSSGQTMMSRMMNRGMMGGMMSSMASMQMMMWIPPSSRVVVSEINGQIVVDTLNDLNGDTLDAKSVSEGVPIYVGDKRVGALFVGTMIELSLNSSANRFIRSVIFAVLITMAAAVGIAYFTASAFVKRTVNPLSALKSAAKDISAGNLGAHIDIATNDEVGELADSFNAMSLSLEEAELMRQRLIADVAHELRTPLSLIRGNLEAILDSVYPLSFESVESIHKQTLFLEKLIEDLRALSLWDAGEFELNIATVDFKTQLSETVEMFRYEAQVKALDLTTEISDEISSAVIDTHRIRQVIGNLISNAIRHTPRSGTVLIRVSRIEGDRILVSVTDSGEGVPIEEGNRVFERFYRTDLSRNRDTGGTGLGLAIAKKIVQAHGGDIGVESSRGNGACFWFTVPASEVSNREI